MLSVYTHFVIQFDLLYRLVSINDSGAGQGDKISCKKFGQPTKNETKMVSLTFSLTSFDQWKVSKCKVRSLTKGYTASETQCNSKWTMLKVNLMLIQK